MSDHDEHSESPIRYEPSGIEERHGNIPKWLVVVYVVLFAWLVWYTIVFWSDGAEP